MKIVSFGHNILARRRGDLTYDLKSRLGADIKDPVGSRAEIFEIVSLPPTTPNDAAHRLDVGDLVLASSHHDLIGDLSVLVPTSIYATARL